MNQYTVVSLFLSVIFLFLALPFFILKEKACNFMQGYSSKSSYEKNRIDQKSLSKHMAKSFLLCAWFFLISSLGCQFISEYFLIVGFAATLFYFYKYIGIKDTVYKRFIKR